MYTYVSGTSVGRLLIYAARDEDAGSTAFQVPIVARGLVRSEIYTLPIGVFRGFSAFFPPTPFYRFARFSPFRYSARVPLAAGRVFQFIKRRTRGPTGCCVYAVHPRTCRYGITQISPMYTSRLRVYPRTLSSRTYIQRPRVKRILYMNALPRPSYASANCEGPDLSTV